MTTGWSVGDGFDYPTPGRLGGPAPAWAMVTTAGDVSSRLGPLDSG